MERVHFNRTPLNMVFRMSQFTWFLFLIIYTSNVQTLNTTVSMASSTSPNLVIPSTTPNEKGTSTSIPFTSHSSVLTSNPSVSTKGQSSTSEPNKAETTASLTSSETTGSKPGVISSTENVTPMPTTTVLMTTRKTGTGMTTTTMQTSTPDTTLSFIEKSTTTSTTTTSTSTSTLSTVTAIEKKTTPKSLSAQTSTSTSKPLSPLIATTPRTTVASKPLSPLIATTPRTTVAQTTSPAPKPYPKPQTTPPLPPTPNPYPTPPKPPTAKTYPTSPTPSTVKTYPTPPTPPTMSPNVRFCNRSESLVYFTRCTSCSDISSLQCKDGDFPAQDDAIDNTCQYGFFSTTGCRLRCLTVYIVKSCCHGFWGDDCDECPGGSKTPCFGNGECLTGNGTCICKNDFTGFACDECSDPNSYGQNCSLACSCVHGKCLGGIHGSGTCLCDSGYTGPRCNKRLAGCENLPCYTMKMKNMRCAEVNGMAQCVCAQGYMHDGEGGDCVAINMCEAHIPPCGKLGTCENTGPGTYKCTCPKNYRGDGRICSPINPCDNNNGGCDRTSSVCVYQGPNQSVCNCKERYKSNSHVDGKGCALVDICLPTSCNVNAICETVEPFKIVCTCKDGFAGNGTVCYGNIVQRLNELNRRHPRFRRDLELILGLIRRQYLEPLSNHGPFTIFVPTDRAFKNIRRTIGYQKFVQDDDRALQVLRQHILIGEFRLEDLQTVDKFYTLQGNPAMLQIRVARGVFRYKLHGAPARAKVLAKNLQASNGMIHIVNGLLTMEPEISGDRKKTALDLIKIEAKYNRLQSLVASVGLEAMFLQPNITVFAPENGAWDSLPAGTLDYLSEDQEGREKLKVILSHHVVPETIGVTHLINKPEITTLAKTQIGISVSKLGRIQLDNSANVTQVNIPCKNGFYHHVDGVLVPDSIEQLLPHKCPETTTKNVLGRCGPCMRKLDMKCLEDTDKKDWNSQVERCRYWGRIDGKGLMPLQGCKLVCTRNISIPQCCPGFYGVDCVPCKGGFKTPCNGRGKCSDGITGTGYCMCDPDFIGHGCDACRRRNVFGPNCTEPCTCVHGTCDEGPKGKGTCILGSCENKFVGENCDKKLVPCAGDIHLCHANASCYKDDQGRSGCRCDIGYRGDGKLCEEIDPCKEPNRGGCHRQAVCTKRGPGAHSCRCIAGWRGSGFECSAISPCSNHTDCHQNATCVNTYPGEYNCVCNIGFHGNGKSCELVNPCLEQNGGCHPKATCNQTGIMTRNCTCPDGMAGDGVVCYGSIASEIPQHPNLTRIAELMKVVSRDNNLLNVLDEEKMTFFAPSDDAMEKFMTSIGEDANSDYWKQEENVVWFLDFHTLGYGYTLADLIQNSNVYDKYVTLYDGFSLHIVSSKENVHIFVNHSDFTTISQPDIPAINGYIHVIDKVLEPFLPSQDPPTISDLFAANPRYSKFAEALQEKGLMDELDDLDEYTIFVIDNDLLSNLNHSLTADYLSYYIVDRFIFTPSVLNNDTANTLLGRLHRLQLTYSGDTLMVNGVPVIRGDVLFDGGVLHELGGRLHPILNRCGITQYKNTTEAECGLCTGPPPACPPGFEDSFIRSSRSCDLAPRQCRRVCHKVITTLHCCGGYYGPECKECPGGPEVPCNNHGRCSDGVKGDGSCECDKQFRGAMCELCTNPLMAPPHCNTSYNSCGYRNGNCSVHATCTDLGGGGVSCRCPMGYVGDGYHCKTLCESTSNNGGCDENAQCVFNISTAGIQCTCKDGYYGNGRTCRQMINPCDPTITICDITRAKCSYVKPKVTDLVQLPAFCECKKRFVGNGSFCVLDLLDALSRIPTLDYFNKWLNEKDVLNSWGKTNVTSIFTDSKKITIFAPASKDWAFVDLESLVVVGEAVMLTSETWANRSSDNEIWTLVALNDQIINITKDQKSNKFMANSVPIQYPNIVSTNGVLHITSTPITQYELLVGSSTSATENNTILLSVVVVVVVVVVTAAIVVMVVVYRRSRHSAFWDIFKRSKQGSESNLSFARLKAQDEDEDSFKGSDITRHDNPIFNDPDYL